MATVAKKKRKILNEEEYIKGVEDIIQRDFFPDLPQLRDHSEYAKALETNDLAKLREISERRLLQEENSVLEATPSTFETPTIDSVRSTSRSNNTNQAKAEDNESSKPDTNVSLDTFMTRNISEDEASFHNLMKIAKQRQREKYSYLYEKEAASQTNNDDSLAITDGNEKKKLQEWPYRVRNCLMYYPDGVDKTTEEILKDRGLNAREVQCHNTRYQNKSIDEQRQRGAIAAAATTSAKQAILAQSGKIDVDGKPYVDESSPAVNGYGFVSTPQIEPGLDMTPVMTWGTIESTPMRIEGDATPGPIFKIPEPPEREKLGLKLSKEISRKQRESKRNSSISVLKASPRNNFMSPVEKLSMLSPAAKRLVNKGFGSKSIDVALRQSYSPSPLRTNGTPKLNSSLTPKINYATNTPTQKPSTPSLTDNMLKLPK
ncbi:Protein DGCR14 [Trichoplax sp. H2]|nr:Protein DGCR14 [Trichoplax sp. H2]|eukprot:RDD46447.1 Protein DGCR14 [Trichoplax sp. H2]